MTADNNKFLNWTKDSVKNHWTAIISKKVLPQMEINVNRECSFSWRCLESRNTYSDLQHVQLFHTHPC